jgi:hypothetical protein
MGKNQYIMMAMLNLLLYMGDNGKKDPITEKLKDLTYNKPTFQKRKKTSPEKKIVKKMDFSSGYNPPTDYGRYQRPIAG